MTPEYFHALTAHLLTLGIALGLLVTAIACVLRSRRACMTGIALIGLCSVMSYPVFFSGHEGYRNVRGLADEQGQAWADLHLERSETVIPGFYLLTAIAGLSFEALRRRNRFDRLLMVTTALLSFGMLVAGGWAAQAGGRISHPEFRPSIPLPVNEELEYEVA